MPKSNQSDKMYGGIVLVAGMLVGAASALLYLKERPKSASEVLNRTKEKFGKRGDIEGSWIDYDPIEYELFEAKPLVYVGGLTVNEGNQLVQYQFACDIYTGDIVDQFMVKSQPI